MAYLVTSSLRTIQRQRPGIVEASGIRREDLTLSSRKAKHRLSSDRSLVAWRTAPKMVKCLRYRPSRRVETRRNKTLRTNPTNVG